MARMAKVVRAMPSHGTGEFDKEKTMGRTKRIARAVAAVIAAMVCAATLSGCGSFTMTCEEYGQKDSGGQASAIMSMISAHGYDWSSSESGTISVMGQVDTYCGIGWGSGATKNMDQRIENAIDWDAVGE